MAMFPLRLFSGFMILALCTARQYIFVNENKTWTEAQSYCRDKYSDLVTIENEQEMEQLLNTVYDYNSSDLAWIGLYDDLNSWKWTLEDSDFFKEGEKQFRNWYKEQPVNYGGQSLCVYVYRGIWSTSNCYSTFGFICYDGRVNASSSYVPVSQPINWTEAQSYCRQHHTDLVSIRNETENQNIYSLTHLYGPAWIGLYRTRSWSDQSNSTFSNWRSGEPNNAGNSEYCTAVAFSDSTWTDENCDYQIPFICYNVTSRQYHFISVNKSWSEAQTYCRQNYIDLATITNMTEMNSVMNTVNGSYNGLAWIGLYDDVNSWRWSLEDDGFYQEGEREFRNWNHEPDNEGGNEMCVSMSVNDGSWFDSSCDNVLPFVCYDGRENATQRYIKITNANTWTEAQRYCREHHTDLVNVRNQTENQRLTGSEGGMIWIGLYRNRIWSNHVISSYQNWKPGRTASERSVELNSFQYCTAVSVDNLGQWTYESCFSIRPFFCYSTLASSRQYHFISVHKSWSEAQTYCRQNYIDLATITNMTEMNRLIKTVRGIYYGSVWIGQYDDMNNWRWSLGNTELEGGFKSWYVQQQRNVYGQSLCVSMSYQGIWQEILCSTMVSFICYDGRQNASVSYVYVNDIKNWTEAQSYCREHHTDLISIRNETENKRIIALVQNNLNNYYHGVWIGLYRTRSWSDQSNSTFSNWRSGEPNNDGNSEDCTAVAFSDAGEWTDQNCYYQLPFICYSVSSLASSPQYHFISVNKSWSEAQTYCRQNYIDLATITNMTEMNSVMNTVNGSYNGSAWIGLYDDVNSWRWSLEDDGFYQEGEREFRNWNHEPDNEGGNEMCVYMTTYGSWFDTSCDRNIQFVCYDGRENASQKYVREYQRKSWSEAQTHCRQFYTDLASVTNETERQQILRINRNIEITDGSDEDKVWIGLHRRKLWSDQSNSSFTYLVLVSWRYAEPDNGLSIPAQTGTQHCTAVSFKSFGYWTDESCFDRLPFFCYSEKYVSGLRVNFLGKDNLSQSQIEEFIDKLKQELVRRGVPGNFTMRLRNYSKIRSISDYQEIIMS